MMHGSKDSNTYEENSHTVCTPPQTIVPTLFMIRGVPDPDSFGCIIYTSWMPFHLDADCCSVSMDRSLSILDDRCAVCAAIVEFATKMGAWETTTALRFLDPTAYCIVLMTVILIEQQ